MKRFAPIFLALAAIMSLCACSSKTATPSQADSDGTYTIVMATALTGGMAEVGNAFECSVGMAIDEVNAFNRENGYDWRFELQVYDDKCDITEATLVANRIARSADKYLVVFGHLFSSTTMACMSTYEQAGLPIFIPTANGDDIKSDNMLRMCLPASVQGPQVAACAVNNCQLKRIALIYAVGDYGVGMAEKIEMAAAQKGSEVVVKESYIAGTDKDFSAILTKIEAAEADGIVIVGDYNEGSMIIQQAGNIAYFDRNDVKFISDASMFSDVFLERIRDCGIEDQILISAYYNPYNQDPTYQCFSKKFTEESGMSTTEPVVYGRDMVYICAEAIRAGATKETLVETVKSLSFSNLISAAGEIRFGPDGNRSTTGATIVGVREGRFYDTGEEVHTDGIVF